MPFLIWWLLHLKSILDLNWINQIKKKLTGNCIAGVAQDNAVVSPSGYIAEIVSEAGMTLKSHTKKGKKNKVRKAVRDK